MRKPHFTSLDCYALGCRRCKIKKPTVSQVKRAAVMAGLVVGPRCTTRQPCGHCWYCRTWKERSK